MLFTGDLGRPHRPLLRPPADPFGADVVITESTNGNRRHENEASALDQLARTITTAADRGGIILIPAFAVDRTEVVLAALARLRSEQRIPALPIFVDSPMALAVLDVYREAIKRHDPELRADLGDAPFKGAGELHTSPTPADSRALNDVVYSSIFISPSGMATGGRVVHHLARRLPDPRNAVVLSGFQAVGTRGQLLADGARSVKLHGRYVPVRADVVQINAFSVHADEDELMNWLSRVPGTPDVAFIVHGEASASEQLRQRLADDLDWTAVVPRPDEAVLVDRDHSSTDGIGRSVSTVVASRIRNGHSAPTQSAPTKFRTGWVTRGRRHLISDPARSSAKLPTFSGDSRVLVVDVGRDDRADPQYEAIESAVEQPGDSDHGGEREDEGVVTEQFRDEEDRDEW